MNYVNSNYRFPWLPILSAIAIVVLLFLGFWGIPNYRVYAKALNGKAQLQEAEYTRQIAALDAQAEVERAKGVAEANEIIGASLQGNEAYLRYLWIQGLQDGSSEVIYVPTEAQLPILEASRHVANAND